MTVFPVELSDMVAFKLDPTVPNAETHSNTICRSDSADSVKVRMKTAMNISINDIIMVALERRMDSCEIFLLKIFGCWIFLTTAVRLTKDTAIVLTLIPPAVD